MNKSPNGLRTVAFGPSISPTMAPIIVQPSNTNEDLYVFKKSFMYKALSWYE